MHKHADVVVIGGGFAGFWAAVAARRAGGPELSIAVVTPNDSLVMRPRLYEANPETLAMPLAEPFAMIDVDLIPIRATSIDADSRLVRLSDGTDIGFGSAVLAIGSVMRVPVLPGIEHAFSIDDQASAIVLDGRLSDIAHQPTVRIAVIGAGFTGIELALELPSRLRQHGRTEALAPVEVVLIDRAPVVGPELGDGPRAEIEAALDEQRVDRRLGATVVAIAPTSVDFADGSCLEVDAVVMCTGMAAASLADPLDGERDALGRYIVGATLEHPQFSGVFLTGDMASADTGTGHRTLQSCQHALQLGRTAGENAARRFLGHDLIDYQQPAYVTCLDLGDHGAVRTTGWDREVVETGASAKAIKQFINQQVIYPDLSGGPEGLLLQSQPGRR